MSVYTNRKNQDIYIDVRPSQKFRYLLSTKTSCSPLEPPGQSQTQMPWKHLYREICGFQLHPDIFIRK